MKSRKTVPPYKHIFSLSSSPRIIPFTGYGSKKQAFISGLVVEENGLSKPSGGQTSWQNLIAMLKRYAAKELENRKVVISYRGRQQEAVTDKYGIFRCSFSMEHEGSSRDRWQKYSVRIPGKVRGTTAEGDVMIVDRSAEYGIISDIDDTILVSHATQKWMKLRLMMLNNAHTRMPFAGVSAFYSALQGGSSGYKNNPIFYVSNSEWNLYDLLYEFIEFNRIPRGPLLLREMAIRVLRPWKMREVNVNHKTEAITRLFIHFPDMKFVLIGDSGQHDPEIYSEVVSNWPGRVPAIYIRDAGIPDKLARIKVLSGYMKKEFSTEMVLVKDTEAAAKHAVSNGLLPENALLNIISGKRKDAVMKSQLQEQTSDF